MSVAAAPEQMDVLPLRVITGIELTATVDDATAVQLPLEAVTEYEVVDVGETIMDTEVAPLLHE